MIRSQVVKVRQLLLVCLLACVSGKCIAAENASSSFSEMLKLAGLGTQEIAKFSGEPIGNAEDWQIVAKLLFRFQQNSPEQIKAWAENPSNVSEVQLGELYRIEGIVVSVEEVPSPDDFSQGEDIPILYRCLVQNQADDMSTEVLTPIIPKGWKRGDLEFREPVEFFGVVLQTSNEQTTRKQLMLTDHLAWFPISGVSSGMVLLARHEMDVALLDEVRHRMPFVKPTISREGDAFYACLSTVAEIEFSELEILARNNVKEKTQFWQEKRSLLDRQYIALKEKVSKSQGEQQTQLKQELKATGKELAMADQVIERSQYGTSSVAPLFLQPQIETGELVRLEGIARRAVKIVVHNQPKISDYYELEIFPPDSQNLPIVCCTSKLPVDFPVGDEIREPVRVSGIFFKNWLYRSRKLRDSDGETNQQQRLYTPIIISSTPTWLKSADEGSPWGFWGGIVFLFFLLALWMNFVRRGRDDRRIRKTPLVLDGIEENHSPLAGEDLPEIKT